MHSAGSILPTGENRFYVVSRVHTGRGLLIDTATEDAVHHDRERAFPEARHRQVTKPAKDGIASVMRRPGNRPPKRRTSTGAKHLRATPARLEDRGRRRRTPDGRLVFRHRDTSARPGRVAT
ncbi:hypothetical protein FRAHR75_210048 [Frankia sp. Hr75.2]|nr:hypothetical protein FRAHR75_210048 [Frankia sp. Hr75.2]